MHNSNDSIVANWVGPFVFDLATIHPAAAAVGTGVVLAAAAAPAPESDSGSEDDAPSQAVLLLMDMTARCALFCAGSPCRGLTWSTARGLNVRRRCSGITSPTRRPRTC
jgi:hypothetical protein